ncbi:hypothetical protein C9374_006712 [Naegleria lovaniensis]|uniref:Uncharacterized protein n=1 Tax=Naegleria lovaniensis TaxID=51637 RepID=A0AA88GML6_NAELO|nr:uncharacterized protein C9374_006712 [Naegleria lovaniensis]KAG2379595.1 hypothetical protein C9374_006712 [Naegleria lovaniensis]
MYAFEMLMRRVSIPTTSVGAEHMTMKNILDSGSIMREFHINYLLKSTNTSNTASTTSSEPNDSSSKTEGKDQQSSNTMEERPLTEEEIKRKKRKRIALIIAAIIASIGGLITLALYRTMLEVQNLAVFSEMIETLHMNNDASVLKNAIFSMEEGFKILDSAQFSPEQIHTLKQIFGDFDSVKSIKLLGPNWIEHIVHRLYILSKDIASWIDFQVFFKESRIYYFFPVVNKETGSVAVMKVALLLDERHIAEIRRLREKTKREMEAKQKKEKEEKLQRQKRQKINEERAKKGEPPLEDEPEKAPESVEEKSEDKPIEVPPIEIESIHICDAAPFAEAFDQSFFAQHDNHHLYGLKELSYSWPYGASYTGGKSEVLIFHNQNISKKAPVLFKSFGSLNAPSANSKLGHFYFENLENQRVKLDTRTILSGNTR